ncbi:hypothetical protein ACLBOM_36570 [Escherichia coli]
MTDKIADLLASGFSLTHQPVAPQTVSAARSIYEMNLCMYGVNNELSSMYSRYGQGGTPLMTIRKLSDGFEISNGNARCGSVRLPAASGSKNSFWGCSALPSIPATSPVPSKTGLTRCRTI